MDFTFLHTEKNEDMNPGITNADEEKAKPAANGTIDAGIMSGGLEQDKTSQDGLQYTVEETPPWLMSIMLGFQVCYKQPLLFKKPPHCRLAQVQNQWD